MEQSFEVDAPIDEVWKALTDPARVAPCLPGASITEMDPDGTYKGTFEVRLGPTTASYRGTLKIDEADEATHRAVLNARGTDKRGQGGASATIVNTLTEVEGRTRVHADTDFTITGRLARFGRAGMIEDISNRLLREFSACLQSQLASAPPDPVAPEPAVPEPEDEGVAGTAGAAVEAATAPASVPPRPPAPAPAPPPPPAAKPISGFSLVLGVLYERLAKLFNRPGRRSGR